MRLSWLAPALLAASPALGLDPSRPLGDFGLASWQQELPQNTVHDVLQTRDGYLWFGTYEGLVRFDGVRFQVFDKRNTTSFSISSVFALHEDRAGALWIGTPGGGAVRYRGGVFRRFGTEAGLPDPYVFSFCEDASGVLWVGTNGGVARLAGDRFQPVPGLDVRRVRSHGLAVDQQGAVWIATESALVRYVSGKATVFNEADGLTSPPRALAVDGRGALWIGTDAGGVHRYEDGRFQAITTREGLAGDSARALFADRHGAVWVGTDGGGLSRIVDGRVSSLTPRDGLPSGLVRAFCEDREGTLWIGTNGGGLVSLKDEKVTTYGARHGLTNVYVRAVREDSGGVLWVGTDGGGLFRLEDGRLQAVDVPGAPRESKIRSLDEDVDGWFWVSTAGSGLWKFRDRRWTATYTEKDGLSDDTLQSLFADRDGSLWIGNVSSGVDRRLGGAIRHVAATQPLANRPVTSFLRDATGALWIGSNGHGAMVERGGVYRRYTVEDGLPSNQVFCFHEDAGGSVWIGTDSGLTRFKAGRFATITSRQGLFDDVAFQILADGEDRFWISCNRGLFRVARRELEAVLDGRAPSVSCRVYGVSDGMGSNQCNGGSTPSAWKGRDGRLWFSTVRGLSVVDPRRIPTNPLGPPVLVEEVIADGSRLALDVAPSLPPGLQKVEFHYTALSFLAPEKVRFRYKLEGYDDAWTEAETRRTAYYTALPPGRYRFRVKACNNDGVWNEAGASFAMALLPPWWRTWWATLLGSAGCVALVLGLVRGRVNSLQRRNQALEQRIQERTAQLLASEQRALDANRAKSAFLANMSHELRTPLNGILGFAQLMARRKGRDAEDRESLEIIGRSGEHLLGLINDVLSLSKIEAGGLTLSLEVFDPSRFLQALLEVLQARAAAKGLALTLESEGLPRAVRGDEGKLRQVLLNLLSNAVKFTERGRVSLSARWREGRALFEVTDSGPGLTAQELAGLFEAFAQTEAGRRSQEGTGLGLVLSRQLARLMGGEITVTSAPAQGATFRLEVALPEADPSAVPIAETRRVVGLAPGQEPRRILVVDDLEQNRLVLSRLLSSVGFETRQAPGGEEALAEWRRFAPSLVFLDKRMPGLGGVETAARLREEERQGTRPRTVLVAVSASALDHERGEMLASGFDDFIAKPYREATIFEKLAEHLGVRYLYDGEPEEAAPRTALEPSRLARLPETLRETLRSAFVAGNFDAAEEALERVRADDAALAETLHQAALQYRSEEVLAALETAARLERRSEERR